MDKSGPEMCSNLSKVVEVVSEMTGLEARISWPLDHTPLSSTLASKVWL